MRAPRSGAERAGGTPCDPAAGAGLGAPGQAHRAPAAELAWVAGVALVFTVVAALLMGRDLNWDYFNYHAYAALLATQDRLTQDFFAASLQGYLNPLPYLPLAAMQAMGWHAALIAGVLAAVQSLNLVFLYLIARLLLARPAPRPVIAAAATVLGASTATLWSQAGSTFIDATLSPLVLAALWLLLRRPTWVGLACAGLLAGAAPGLKWTLVPYAVALCLAAAGLPGAPGERLRRLAFVGAAAALGFALTYGHWGWRLHQAFGSPVFPLFNGLFQAPDYPLHSDQFLRFVPDTLAGWLAFPFRMAQHGSWIYVEVGAPDLRPALAVVLGLAGCGAWLLQRARRGAGGAASAQQGALRGATCPGTAGGAASVLLIFFAVSLALWLKTSSNGRYAVPTFLLLGPIVWLLCERVAGLRAGRVLGLLVLGLQLVHLGHAGNPRWNAQPWSRELLPVQLPPELTERPLLFLTVGMPSESYLAARVHPQSAFGNAIGMYSVPTDGPGWGRFVALRDRWAGRTRVVFRMPAAWELVSPLLFSKVDDMVDRLGLRVVPGSCLRIEANAGWGDLLALAVCEARPKLEPDAELARQRALARRITDGLQARCPRYFQPAAPEVEGMRDKWARRYLRHDLVVSLDFTEDLITFRQANQALAVPIGRVSSWQRDVEGFACRLPHAGRRDISTLLPEVR